MLVFVGINCRFWEYKMFRCTFEKKRIQVHQECEVSYDRPHKNNPHGHPNIWWVLRLQPKTSKIVHTVTLSKDDLQARINGCISAACMHATVFLVRNREYLLMHALYANASIYKTCRLSSSICNFISAHTGCLLRQLIWLAPYSPKINSFRGGVSWEQ